MTMFFFFPVEKSVSEVLDNTVEHVWEEGRMEDELSPEEIQMVWHFKHRYTLCVIQYIYSRALYLCLIEASLYIDSI